MSACRSCGTESGRFAYCSDACKPRCGVKACEQPVRKGGWCASHYAQAQKSGRPPEPFKWKWGQADPRPKVERAPRPARVCSIDGCGEKHEARGYCIKHVTRFRRYGDPLFVQRVWTELQPCVVCGSNERSIQSRRFCSPPCEALFYRHGGEVPTERACAQCGDIISFTERTRTGQRRRSTARLCKGCQKDSWRDECLTVAELAARDGAACSLCGEGVDMTLRRADGLMCPSIDHVVPRSRGGSNEPENLALAHLICNIRKSDRLVEVSVS